MKLHDLFENSEKFNDREFSKMLRDVERDLPRESRYKSYDFDKYTKTVWWITQEEPTQETPKIIAQYLSDQGYDGWTVKVCQRDYYRGDEESTPADKILTAKS